MLKKINYTEIPDSLREAHYLVIDEIFKAVGNSPRIEPIPTTIGNLIVDIVNGNHPLSENKECNDIVVILIGVGITNYIFPKPNDNPLLLLLEKLQERIETVKLQDMDIPKSMVN